MKNRFQLGFLLGSLLPLAALCALGHSERVSLLSGAGFLLVPALLWPRRVSGWLERLQGFYERFYAAGLPPAKCFKRQAGIGGPQRDSEGQICYACGLPSSRCTCWYDDEPNTANAKPKPESARRRQSSVESALRNFGASKSQARAIAQQVARLGLTSEMEQIRAGLRMVRA